MNRPSGIDLTVDFSVRLFRPETVRGMVDDFLSIIDRIADDQAVTVPALVRQDEVPLDDVMRRLWAAAFCVDNIGVDDDFFELGGSSLLGAQIVAGLSEILGVEVTLRMFFESATIRELADRITAEHAITAVAADRLAGIAAVGSIDELVAGIHELSDEDVDLAVRRVPTGDDPVAAG